MSALKPRRPRALCVADVVDRKHRQLVATDENTSVMIPFDEIRRRFSEFVACVRRLDDALRDPLKPESADALADAHFAWDSCSNFPTAEGYNELFWNIADIGKVLGGRDMFAREERARGG